MQQLQGSRDRRLHFNIRTGGLTIQHPTHQQLISSVLTSFNALIAPSTNVSNAASNLIHLLTRITFCGQSDDLHGKAFGDNVGVGKGNCSLGEYESRGWRGDICNPCLPSLSTLPNFPTYDTAVDMIDVDTAVDRTVE
jgi:hypothetical protein